MPLPPCRSNSSSNPSRYYSMSKKPNCITACFFFTLLILIANSLKLEAAIVKRPPEFKVAKAVWPDARETEMNLTVGFRAVFDRPSEKPVVLQLAGSSLYRVWLNGQFVGTGPARSAKGFFRVDRLDLTDRLVKGKNWVLVEVAGYNANSFYLLDQPSFLQAELTAGTKVIAATLTKKNHFGRAVRGDRVRPPYTKGPTLFVPTHLFRKLPTQPENRSPLSRPKHPVRAGQAGPGPIGQASASRRRISGLCHKASEQTDRPWQSGSAEIASQRLAGPASGRPRCG